MASKMRVVSYLFKKIEFRQNRISSKPNLKNIHITKVSVDLKLCDSEV